MVTIHQILESFVTWGKEEFAEDELYAIYKNPTLAEMGEMAKDKGLLGYGDYVRCFLLDGDVYAWSGDRSIHGEAIKALRREGIDASWDNTIALQLSLNKVHRIDYVRFSPNIVRQKKLWNKYKIGEEYHEELDLSIYRDLGIISNKWLRRLYAPNVQFSGEIGS